MRRQMRVPLTLLSMFLVMSFHAACSGAAEADTGDPDGRITATYLSDQGERLTAVFDTVGDRVEITLPGGRKVILPRGVSASGARFTDGRETFWEHHGEGSYWLGEERIFHGQTE